jgi:hypothetical protein
MSTTLRPFIRSVAGDADRYHDRPFVLGKPVRHKCGDGTTLRLWHVDIRMPDDPKSKTPTWCRGVLMIDEEVFDVREEAAQ